MRNNKKAHASKQSLQIPYEAWDEIETFNMKAVSNVCLSVYIYIIYIYFDFEQDDNIQN